MNGYVPFTERHGSLVAVLITETVADVDDATLFPNIAEAREHARKLRDNAVGIDRSVVEGGHG